MAGDHDLFGEETVPPMVRRPDMVSSVMAAMNAQVSSETLRGILLHLIRLHQPITALELEDLPVFEALAPSTVRKRVSELKGMGRIEEAGLERYTTPSGRKTKAMAWRVSQGVQPPTDTWEDTRARCS